jgi:uncharacterized protein
LRKLIDMLTVISPAKTLNFETSSSTSIATKPQFLDDAAILIQKLRSFSPKKLMGLMDISQDLAMLNARRYLAYESGIAPALTKQAILAFDGDVYQGLDTSQFMDGEFEFAQAHLRILSGLYGVLRPLDMIQPHRLEMGTKLKVGRRKNLYDFWGSRITNSLNEAVAVSGSKVLLNLASQEYFGAVRVPEVAAQIVTPVFLDRKGDAFKVVSFWAKKARGKMCAWIIHNRVDEVDSLRQFEAWGYRFNPAMSTMDTWAFTRDAPQQ